MRRISTEEYLEFTRQYVAGRALPFEPDEVLIAGCHGGRRRRLQLLMPGREAPAGQPEEGDDVGAPSAAQPFTPTDLQDGILNALRGQGRPMKAAAIALILGRAYNSYFRSALRALVAAGLIRRTEENLYFLPADLPGPAN